MDEGARRGLDAGLDRVTIQEAARRLGVSEGAVRKRVTRNTLRHDKAPDGRISVYLDTGVDEGLDEGVDAYADALVSEMQERIAFLERELSVRSEEIRRRDTIIMNMTEAMKALNGPAAPEAASQGTPESPQTVEEEPEGQSPGPLR